MARSIKLIALAASVAAAATLLPMMGRSGATEPVDPVPVLPISSPRVAAERPAVQPVERNPDPRHPMGRLIEVSIDDQRLTAWRDGKVVYRFVISTGRDGYETPPGRYKILEKHENRWSRTWSVWMPYAMRWFRGYFIHQLPHKDGSSHNIGASKLGTPDSHGCVRVDVGDAKKLFIWTKVGTPVWVH